MSAIFYPVIALAALTSAVLLRIPYVRFKAGYAGRVKVKDFRYGESGKVPGDRATCGLAWTYVALGAAHSLIHRAPSCWSCSGCVLRSP